MTRTLLALVLGLVLGARAADPGGLPVLQRAAESPSARAAAQLLEAEAQVTAEPQALGWILLHAGEARRLAGDLSAARRHFLRVTIDFPQHPARGPASLGLAVIDAGGRAGGNTLATLELVPDAGVPGSLNAERHLLLASAWAREGGPTERVAAALARARELSQDHPDLRRRVERLTLALGPAAPPAEGPPVADDLVAILEVRAALSAGAWADARARAEAFLTRFPDSALAAEARYSARRAELARPPSPRKVAVLLPLSGAWAPPGKNLRAAIESANEHGAVRATLAFYDTAGSAANCVNTLEKAVLEEGASVVIGPLLKDEAVACAPVAQALRVPMLPLTSSDEASGAGDLIHRTFPTTEEQVEALLDEVYDRRALHAYAVLHPQTPYGENAARVFAAAVASRGGKVPTVLPYPADTADFRPLAKQLEARGKPTELYDAIFLPDSYQRVALLASALAFEEIPVGRFRPHGGDDPLVLVGLSAWNNDDLVRRGGTYVLDSIFVDAFDGRSSRPPVTRFLEAWGATGLGAPSVVEAVGWDTMLLVDQALAAGGGLPAALRAVRFEEPGAAGTVGFGGDRVIDREFRLLTVTRGGIVPVDAAWSEGSSPTP